MPLISPRYCSGSSLATARRARHLDLLQELMALDVNDTDPVRTVVSDIRLGAVGSERDIERLGETRDGLDLGQRLHVDHGDRVPSGLPW